MGIAERIGKITAGRNVDFGARPSKEQERAKDRTREAIGAAKSRHRKMILQRKKAARKAKKVYRHNPAPLAACRNTRSISGGSGREETLGAMRGLDPTSTAYVMFNHAQDRSSFDKALDGLSMKALDLHIDMGWCRQKSGKERMPDQGKDVIRSMVRLALFELNGPKCAKCRGTKCGRNGGMCRRCGGTGKLRISDKDRSIALDVGYDAFRKTYSTRYSAIIKMVKGVGRAALQKMHFNLYGDHDWDLDFLE